jgi:acyl-CoA thioester hydrolase
MQASPHRFQIILDVQPADIDELDHVNNAVYLRWVQEVAVAHWRAVVPPETQAATLWVVLRHEIDYKAAAVMGDQLLIETWVGTASKISFERHTEIFRAADRQLIVRARTLWCPIDPATKRPKRIDPEVRALFSV